MPRSAVEMDARVLRQEERRDRVEVGGFGEVDIGRGDHDERVAAHRHQRLRVRVVPVHEVAPERAVDDVDLGERVTDVVHPTVGAGELEVGGRAVRHLRRAAAHRSAANASAVTGTNGSGIVRTGAPFVAVA